MSLKLIPVAEAERLLRATGAEVWRGNTRLFARKDYEEPPGVKRRLTDHFAFLDPTNEHVDEGGVLRGCCRFREVWTIQERRAYDRAAVETGAMDIAEYVKRYG